MTTHSQSHIAPRTKGFTLIEVVLAIGIFLLSILALVGLLGPTLSSVEDVTQADEVTSVVNTVNAFLMNSPTINQGGSRFNAIYNALRDNEVLTLYVFRRFDGAGVEEALVVGFPDDYGVFSDILTSATPVSGAIIDPSHIANAAGPIFRVLLSASSVTPENLRSETDSAIRVPNFVLTEDLANYPEGYLAMEVKIYSEEPGRNPTLGFYDRFQNLPSELQTGIRNGSRQPIFTYNMAIVR